MTWIVGGIILFILWFIMWRWLLIPFFSPKPETLGWQGNSFEPCSSSVRCVSSTDTATRRSYVEPLSFTESESEQHQRFVTILTEMPRTEIITNSDNYLHGVSRSLVWGFFDDVEIFIDADNNVIHLRSEARFAPISDLRVNYNRIQKIKSQYEAQS